MEGERLGIISYDDQSYSAAGCCWLVVSVVYFATNIGLVFLLLDSYNKRRCDENGVAAFFFFCFATCPFMIWKLRKMSSSSWLRFCAVIFGYLVFLESFVAYFTITCDGHSIMESTDRFVTQTVFLATGCAAFVIDDFRVENFTPHHDYSSLSTTAENNL